MPYFAIQVKFKSEEKFLRFTELIPSETDIQLIWPRRRLKIRRKGEWLYTVDSIFSGYLFLKANNFSLELYEKLKHIPYFIRFLENNDNIVPLSKSERDIIDYFISFGEAVDKSMVIFDENDKIRVIEGPLKDLEGKIVKVNKRKERAKVRLDLYKKSFLVDFSFETLVQV